MIDFDKMQVGETFPLSTMTDWDHPDNKGEFMRAQAYTEETRGAVLFSVDTVWKDTPAGRKISGYTITRTK